MGTNHSRPGGRPKRGPKTHKNSRSNDGPRSEVERRIDELDADRDPISLAEEIAKEQHSNNGTSGTIAEEHVHITELQQMSSSELQEFAENSGIKDYAGLNKKDLIFRILKEQLKQQGLMRGEGTLEILPDGFGFLRSSDYHYMSCPDDIYVSPSQIRKFALRTGTTVSGQIRPPKENERYFALLRVESVDFSDPIQMSKRIAFDDLTPLHPDDRIQMEHDADDVSTRILDIVTPIGFGQRGLIVSPPRSGKTVLLQKMARAVLANYPNAYVMMLLIDERPEEVTDMEREVKGPNCEVVSSTFDEHTSRHIAVSEMVIEKAKRLVETGKDVIIFLDSITRLARAWNTECNQSGRTMTGGLDANALQNPKAFFGSARKLEEGGSLTILATALIDTGSRMDDVIFEEFKGTGNLEIVLSRQLADKRIYPSIDINLSGTRREEKLMDPEEHRRICLLRRALHDLNPPDAMDMLVEKMRKTQNNAEFLMGINGP